jgi:hypothetical protein
MNRILKVVINILRPAAGAVFGGGLAASLLLLGAAACGSSSNEPTPPGDELQTARLRAAVGSTRFVTHEAFVAAAEMQISGEPFAEAMGRDLGNYRRDHLPTDICFDTSPVANGD